MSFIHLNGVTIHYRYIESRFTDPVKRCFVFINSLGTDFRIWEEVSRELHVFGSILMFDNRGHGLSDMTANTNGLNDFANDLLALLEKLSVEKYILVGLSVGGMIAQIIANRKPKMVDRLVLCDTRHKIGNAQIWNERISAVRESGIAAISDGVVQRWFSEKFRMEEPVKVAGYKNMLERTPVLGYIQTCEAIRDADLTDIARQIKIPTLCLVGSEDRSTPPEEVKQLSDLIKDSGFKVIKGSGHIPCVDNPKELSALITDFIKNKTCSNKYVYE